MHDQKQIFLQTSQRNQTSIEMHAGAYQKQGAYNFPVFCLVCLIYTFSEYILYMRICFKFKRWYHRNTVGVPVTLTIDYDFTKRTTQISINEYYDTMIQTR